MTGVGPVAVSLLAVSGEAKKSGPIGLAVILVLCIVCYFLFKSMSRHMRKVREEFPADETPPADAPADEPAEALPADAPVDAPDAASRPDQPG